MALRERIVVGGVGPAVRFSHTKIGKEKRARFILHRSAAIGMKGELSGRDVVLGDGVVEQGLEQDSVSASATHQPTTLRLKMSMMT